MSFTEQAPTGEDLKSPSNDEKIFEYNAEENLTLLETSKISNDSKEKETAPTADFQPTNLYSHPPGKLRLFVIVLACFIGLLSPCSIISSPDFLRTCLENVQPSNNNSKILSKFLFIQPYLIWIVHGLRYPFTKDETFERKFIASSILVISGLIGMANFNKIWQTNILFSLYCAIGAGVLLSEIVGIITRIFKKGQAWILFVLIFFSGFTCKMMLYKLGEASNIIKSKQNLIIPIENYSNALKAYVLMNTVFILISFFLLKLTFTKQKITKNLV